MLHRLSSLNCTQRTPAGLPSGMPGIGDEMEGAMQQAAHPGRHCMSGLFFMVIPHLVVLLMYFRPE
jgi:hypothetical protein